MSALDISKIAFGYPAPLRKFLHGHMQSITAGPKAFTH